MGAITETLFESELFGYEKGAFTGATSARPGKFELAHEGTLLLDEITEMPLHLQAKLLRVLQEREFKRVGSQKIIKADVRVIATTNRNIGDSIREGAFRKDLYYRISVFPISIPPLRERREDIPVLAEFFIAKYAHENGLPGKKLTGELVDWMFRQAWKGNVRELENLMQRGVILSGEDPNVTINHLTHRIFDRIEPSLKEEIRDLPLMSIEDMELLLIHKALVRTNGNQKEAARLLGISDRTIRNKLKRNPDSET